jgi:long-chain fatty acid transport protein
MRLLSSVFPSPPSHQFVLSACLALFLGGLVGVSSTQAQGFAVTTHGSCVTGRAGTAAAVGCGDGSSIYYNPANLAATEGFTASLGATVIRTWTDFTYDSVAEAPSTGRTVKSVRTPQPVPHGYLSYRVSDRVSLGLGAYAPYGLGTEWPQKLDDGTYFDGAFLSFKSRLQSIYVQPTIGIQASEKLRVGFGPIIAISTLELNRLQDLSQVPTPTGATFGQIGVPFHTAFARSSLESDPATGFGLNLGLSYEVSERLRLGGRFMSSVDLSYEGDASFEQIDTGLTVPVDLTDENGNVVIPAGTPLDNVIASRFQSGGLLRTQSLNTGITLPMQVVGGVSFQATDALLLLADYQFTEWSVFEEVALDFEEAQLNQVIEQNYENSHTIRLGAEYDILDGLTVRGGYVHSTAATPDETVTPQLAESTRNQFALGIGWRPIDRFEVDAAYQLTQQNDRRGRVRGPLSGETLSTDLNQGLFKAGASLFATTLTLHL